MGAWLVFLLAVLLSACNARKNDSGDKCYAKNNNPYLFMGTKTSYECVHSNILPLAPCNTCKPAQIWALIRHGARYPGEETVAQFFSLPELRDRIVDNHERRGKGFLCKEDLENFRRWNIDPDLDESKANHLTLQGEEDSRLLAKRLQAAFPEILQLDPQNVSQRDFKFRATIKERTKKTMHAFMDGLFNGSSIVRPEESRKNDSVLYAYKNCPAYRESLINDHVDAEADKFTEGPEFSKVLQDVSERLGFDCNIDNDTLVLMYDMCRFEKSWHSKDRLSVWCSAFSEDDMKVLEYREDLRSYYNRGPGRRINELIGCTPLQDMINHFRNVERGEREPKGIFYFSHSVSLQTTMAAMGIGKDSPPLRATNYCEMEDRNFRTSLIGPFSANIVAVYYRCNNEEESDKVMFYVSEKVVVMDDCPDGICDWEYVEQKFGNAADQCNLDFCYRPN